MQCNGFKNSWHTWVSFRRLFVHAHLEEDLLKYTCKDTRSVVAAHAPGTHATSDWDVLQVNAILVNVILVEGRMRYDHYGVVRHWIVPGYPNDVRTHLVHEHLKVLAPLQGNIS